MKIKTLLSIIILIPFFALTVFLVYNYSYWSGKVDGSNENKDDVLKCQDRIVEANEYNEQIEQILEEMTLELKECREGLSDCFVIREGEEEQEAKVSSERPQPITDSEAFQKPVLGRASWYDYDLPNSPDYSKIAKTCASRDYPKGTILEVLNVHNGRITTCRVNDWVENPDVIIDLSSKAFKELSPLSAGIIEVQVLPVK